MITLSHRTPPIFLITDIEGSTKIAQIAQVHNPEQHLVNDNGLHHGLARR